MQIKYVGPRPLISTRGITFDKKKHDKFIYIDSVLQLLEAIDYDYVGTKPHLYTTQSRKIVGDDMLAKIKECGPDMEKIMIQAHEDAERYLDEEVNRTRNSIFFSEEEINSLLNNLRSMREYRIQRYINKEIYYYVIDKFIERLRHNKIKYISASAHANYFHIFYTIKRGLLQQKNAINSEITYYVKEGALYTKLQVLST